MPAHGGDDLAAAAEQCVAEFDHPQIGPRPRAQPDDLAHNFVRRPAGSALCQDQDRGRGRARHAGMAVHQEMRQRRLLAALATGSAEVPGKGEQQLDVPALGRDPTRQRLDYIVKVQLQAPMHVEQTQSLGLGPARIEDRQHMGDAVRMAVGELIEPADRDPE